MSTYFDFHSPGRRLSVRSAGAKPSSSDMRTEQQGEGFDRTSYVVVVRIRPPIIFRRSATLGRDRSSKQLAAKSPGGRQTACAVRLFEVEVVESCFVEGTTFLQGATSEGDT